jgi:UDP-N-acetylmuramoyl-L-alanyl-D-glutamate--2,6-diaminopimelate ligase
MLTGSFNVYNSLAALAVGISQGISLAEIKAALEQVPGVAGRMERIQAGQDFTCIVDYAHTPDAMNKVLGILRPLTKGKLIAVIGSAGERDLAKRPMIGATAARWCDFFVIADEDPRFEDPLKIINEIAAGAEAEGRQDGKDFLKIADRRAAIATAFDHAASGDIVALLGKGHEQCIIVGKDKLPWDDRTVARELLTVKFT